jgi:capsular exopolysaccharide synthesis family protein
MINQPMTNPPASAAKQPQEENKIDFRVYLGIILFRWQIIALCFLYCLLAGVLYIHLAPKKFQSKCNVMIYRDPLLTISKEGAQWSSLQTHTYMLENPKLTQRVIGKLVDEWGEKMGGRRRMDPNLSISRARGGRAPMLSISVQAGDSAYSRAFLNTLLEEHREEWENVQRQSRVSAGTMLEDELAQLEEQIRTSEDDVIEYQRLNDIARVEARGTMESRYLAALMERRNQLTTELMLLEAQYPALKDASAAVIRDVGKLTKTTGEVSPLDEDSDKGDEGSVAKPSVTGEEEEDAEIKGFQNLRVKLAKLEKEETQLARNLKEDHPKLKEVRDQIEDIRSQLAVSAEVQMQSLHDRHRALTIQLDAIETAEYKWQAKNLMASSRQAEYKRLQSVVNRFEKHYDTLYSRLHEMRVAEELKAEHFVPEDISTEGSPIWPDPMKILLVALVGGLGSGFGLAFMMQVVDNKVQSIKDVEDILGVPFLGGIPFWAHSGLESAIRPIVTEEHSTGAIEAYRALRTSVLSELNKKHEKILMITSADSREGKTLTALNMAIMVAQMGKRVLVVDMDLRRGRLHRSLGLDREPGVTDVLREGGTLKDVIQPARIENLYLAPSGSGIDDSAELLQSADIVQMFVDIQDDYDYIFVDTSPVLRVTDTVILTSQGMGQVLYVARVNHTPKPMIRYSLDMLKDANVLGLVMNSIEMHKISSLYYAYQYPNYAYYSNAYTYGYNYYYYDDQGGKGRRHRRGTIGDRLQKTGQWFRKNFLPIE